MRTIRLRPNREVLSICGLLGAMTILYGLVTVLALADAVGGIMLALVILTALAGGYRLCQQYDEGVLARYILFLGLVMRIGYMLYTPCTVRYHDLGALSADGDGHAAYMLTLLEGRLPAGNQGQFYHPPLYHLLSALAALALRPLLGLRRELDLVNCGRLVSCMFSCLTLLCVSRLCEERCGDKPVRGRILPLALTAFLPNLYLMGGRVNNDAAAVFFSVMILRYSLRWAAEQSVKNTVALALSFGLGMLCKLSVAALALPTGLLMLRVAAAGIHNHRLWRTLRRLGLFAVISLPLGLAYPLRNFLLFGQPLGYVLPMDPALFSAWEHSFAARFLSFPVAKLFHPLYNDAYGDYNVWLYLLKGGLFGEFRFAIAPAIPELLLSLYGLLSLVMAAGVVWSVKDRDPGDRFLFLSAAVLTAAYLVFNLRYPYGCTMDFRYIAPVFIVNALLLSRFLQAVRSRKGGLMLCRVSGVLVGAWSALSVLMFCIL